ncbi:MAG: S8 family serine peptidase [Xanthomonadales bacterium]|nr:S8 family serine peptidase [Xanthomonadales bacterium]
MQKHAIAGALALILGCTLGTAAIAAKPEMERVWVKFRDNNRSNSDAAIQQAGGQVHHRFNDIGAYAVSVPSQALNGLMRNPNVEYVEPDVARYPSAQSIPYGIDMVQARDVWDANRDGNVDPGAPNGSGVMVCVIDSGLSVSHDDHMSNAIVGGYPAGWDNDTCGHGTHVAGTINAANNNTGVVGVSPGGAYMYIVKVFDGPDCGWSYSSDLVNAANVCASLGAKVISMSLGGSSKSRAEDAAFEQLYNQGLLSIAAAGNDGNTRKSYPASYDSVISVAAVDSSKAHADFSQSNSQVELSAPGVGVLSTVPWNGASFSVGGTDYQVSVMEDSVQGTASGALANGGTCESSGSWNGQIVLCQRGNISFADKANNAAAGGAAGVVVYNNEPGGFGGTLSGAGPNIPVQSMSQEDGEALVASSLGQNASMSTVLIQPASGYEAWDGTSMATPHVSGVAALIWSANPGWTNAQVRDAMAITAEDLGAAGRDNEFGWGLVQAADAIDYLNGNGTGNPNPPSALVASGGYVRNKFVVDLSWSDGAQSVNVYRDGIRVATVQNNGSYSESLRVRGSGTLSYLVCDADTSNCTNSASVNY